MKNIVTSLVIVFIIPFQVREIDHKSIFQQYFHYQEEELWDTYLRGFRQFDSKNDADKIEYNDEDLEVTSDQKLSFKLRQNRVEKLKSINRLHNGHYDGMN